MEFSIIIPFYNVGSYIEECIRSVANQHFPKDQYEIICVDDCSPDNSRQVVHKLMREYPNISLICHDENKRQGGARNTGLRQAKGNWILFIDSDDAFADPNLLSNIDNLLSLHPDVDFIKTGVYNSFRQNFQAEVRSVEMDTDYAVMSGKDYMLLDPFMPHVVFGCYNRKFLFDNNLFFREHVFFEDTDWSLKVYLAAKKTISIKYPFYAYRENLSSTTQHFQIGTYIDTLTSLNECYNLSRGQEMHYANKILSRVKNNIISSALYSRNFQLKDSRRALRYLNSMDLMDLKAYPDATPKEKILLNIIRFAPMFLYAPLRIATLISRKIKHIIK